MAVPDTITPQADSVLTKTEVKPDLASPEASEVPAEIPAEVPAEVSSEAPAEVPVEPEDAKPAEPAAEETPKVVPAPKPEIIIHENIDDALPNHQKQYLLKALKSIKRLKDAAPFLTPVDTEGLQIPLYYNVVTEPMDISTIENKLSLNGYRTPEEMQADFNLMVGNCIKFNGDKSPISRMGQNIQASFEKLLLHVPPREIANDSRLKSKAALSSAAANGVPKIRRDLSASAGGRPKREIHPPKPKDMPYDTRPRNKRLLTDLRFASQVLKELTSKKHEAYSYPFLEPVDPVALDCPTYFDFVKKPMDLSTISNKLQNNQYDALEEFHDDVKLVFHNCYIFNPSTSPVNTMGHKLEAVFDKRYLERPVHPPTPPSGGLDDSDLEGDIDEDEEVDIEQSIMNNQAIQFLEQQIERMKKDLEKMKKDEYEKAKKRALKQKKKKGKKKGNGIKRRKLSWSGEDGEMPIEITFDMKKELSEQITNSSEKKLQHVMKIIRDSVPDLVNDQEEIELDMDMLDDGTLLKLYNYVVPKNPLGKKKGRNNSISLGLNGNSKRKSLTKKANDRDKKIDILKQRLQEYDKGTQLQNSDSSDDDDDDSESSEEE